MTQPSEASIRKACEEIGVEYIHYLRTTDQSLARLAIIALARRIEAEAKNAKLREALERIANGLPCELAHGKIVNAPIRGQEAQRMARAALGGEHER